MRRNLKRLLALAMVLALSLIPGAFAEETAKIQVAFAGDQVIDWTQNDMVKWIKDNYGLEMECTYYPTDAWMNQLSLMLLTDELPDMIYNNTLANFTTINSYGDEGYFLNFRDYLDVMPNFKEHLEKYPELNRRITDEEYETLVDYAIEIGIENGFIQEGDTAEESFIPAFDCEGV